MSTEESHPKNLPEVSSEKIDSKNMPYEAKSSWLVADVAANALAIAIKESATSFFIVSQVKLSISPDAVINLDDGAVEDDGGKSEFVLNQAREQLKKDMLKTYLKSKGLLNE